MTLFESLNSEEKVVAQLLEDLDYRNMYLDSLLDTPFTNEDLNLIVKFMTKDCSFQNILVNTNKRVLLYAMDLRNAYQQYLLQKPMKIDEMLSPSQAKESFIQALPPSHYKYAYTLLFDEVYSCFIHAYLSKGHHKKYIVAYENWKNYITMEEIKKEYHE